MSSSLALQRSHYDTASARAKFPILARRINGHPLAFLDNAASTQRPQSVIAAVDDYERHHHANVHRGVYTLSAEATERYEGAREKIARFINAASSREVIFVRGTTEAINLIAQSDARNRLVEGDEILITGLEHHANIVPWQMVCAQTGARLVVAPVRADGSVHEHDVVALMRERTRIFACAHASNALGTVLPVAALIAHAKTRGIMTVIDGAQAMPHFDVDVRALGCDFYAFSGHKMFAPTGIGVLYGHESRLEAMPPWQGGGDMILSVSFEGTTYNSLPYKFEAGTPNISGAVGLGAAVDFLRGMDRAAAHAHEDALLHYASTELARIPGLRLVGTADEKVSVVSFVVEGAHPHDLGTILDSRGIAVRTGHHCAMPVMERFNVPATVRASFAFFNEFGEVDRLVQGVQDARAMLT